MIRGILAGLFSGTALSGVVLAGLSIFAELPNTTPPKAVSVNAPEGTEFDPSQDDSQADLPKLASAAKPDDLPQVEAPDTDDLGLKDGATNPGTRPETKAPDVVLLSPDQQGSDAGVTVESETPVFPNPQALAPQPPETEIGVSVSTEPADPVIAASDPDVSEATPEVTEDTADDPDANAEARAEAQAEDQDVADAVDPEDTTAPDDTAEIELAQADPQAGDVDVAINTDEQPRDSKSPPVEIPQEDDVTAPQAEGAPQAEAAPEPKTSRQTAETETEQDAGTIGNLATDVKTDRLPSVGVSPTQPVEAAQTESNETEQAQLDASAPPIQRFAAEFQNPDAKPLMSIVLIDDGRTKLGAQALADFPYPISFAVDASRSDAADAAALYRANGYEVLAMADLPDDAKAVDAEVTMATYLQAVPEAVAVMEGTGTGLQASRETSEQLAAILLDSGHGLVMFANGLNTAQKLIEREGVPAATVFRDFDGKGQNVGAIRRFLDQAAFKAGRGETGVIMVGRVRPETINALLLWGLEDRATSVALAPVSAVLTAQ